MTDAIDINDFVYAATGARVRRVTLADGSHWFPAMDVCRELGHSNTSEAVRRHVPASMKYLASALISRELLPILTAHGLRPNTMMLSLEGLIRLVNGCVKPECEPFKNWAAEVIAAVQRGGGYALTSVAPTLEIGDRSFPILPESVLDVIVRLEERNLRLDAEFAAAQQEQQVLLRDLVAGVHRIADAMERQSATPPIPTQRSVPTAADILAAWRERLSVTEDVWSVAAHLVPIMLAHGEAARSIESIATHTGLTQERVRDCLRFLQKRACIRQVGTTSDGTPRYRLTEH